MELGDWISNIHPPHTHIQGKWHKYWFQPHFLQIKENLKQIDMAFCTAPSNLFVGPFIHPQYGWCYTFSHYPHAGMLPPLKRFLEEEGKDGASTVWANILVFGIDIMERREKTYSKIKAPSLVFSSQHFSIMPSNDPIATSLHKAQLCVGSCLPGMLYTPGSCLHNQAWPIQSWWLHTAPFCKVY